MAQNTVNKPVVLLVEDEALIRMTTAAMIQKAGFDVVEAPSADEAIQILESRSDIRVVFTDVDMPGSIDGLRLAHVVRNRWPPIQLIVASGHKGASGLLTRRWPLLSQTLSIFRIDPHPTGAGSLGAHAVEFAASQALGFHVIALRQGALSGRANACQGGSMVSVVSFHQHTRNFVVEEKPGGETEAELTAAALRLRVRQQQILAELGVLALRGTPFPELLDYAARLTAQGLNAEFAKVLEYMPAEQRFLVRAGVGWGPGVVGSATVGADVASPSGYALRTGKPVISNHLENEQRFRTPELLIEHGIRRAMNVILQGDDSPFGVLEVDSRSEGEFSESDITFLQGAANILGMAIERQRLERHLRQAVDRQQLLLKEVNHRVNNSLQIVASMLHLQAAASENPRELQGLNDAARRVGAISRAHQRLYAGDNVETLDLGSYLRDVCEDIHNSMPGSQIHVDAGPGIEFATDRAIPVGIVINELITNAAKYAYPSGSCRVWVTITCGADGIVIVSVSDEGVGLPPDFNLKSGRRLGMRLINAFATQLAATLEVNRHTPGTEFLLSIPQTTRLGTTP